MFPANYEAVMIQHKLVDPVLFTQDGIVNALQRVADDGSLTPNSLWAAKMLRLSLTACHAFNIHPSVALNYEIQRISPILDAGDIPDLNPSLHSTPSTLTTHDYEAT